MKTCTVAIALLLLPSVGRAKDANKQIGVIRHEQGAFDGYTLIAPMHGTETYLVDMNGAAVHTWKDAYSPGQSAYLLLNGHLLRCDREPNNRAFHGGGIGGRIREFDWDGNLLWDYDCSDDRHCQHHDIEPMPNGNVLVIAWEKKTADEAIGAGRDPDEFDGDELWPDEIIEVTPGGRTSGKVVWEWHAWDHLVQDADVDRSNYGVVADHPELIDINFTARRRPTPPDELAHLRAIGYVGGEGPPGGRPDGADWLHCNAISYNAKLDQIVLSVHEFSEIWIIDHSTTTQEAAGHTGGRSGKGGDLLYRWGNPQTYRAGGADDQRLFAQHDARWIAGGSGSDAHILVFNNGRGRPNGDYSSVDEIALPLTADGKYAREDGAAFGPTGFVWSYASSNKPDFFAGHISGAQRLPNGNTLICSGEQGRVFEVDRQGEIVWDFISPFVGERGLRGERGPNAPDGPPPGRRFQQSRGDDERSADGEQDDDNARPRQRPRDGRRGPGGPGRGGPPDEANALFRVLRYAPDDPALKGRNLTATPKAAEEKNHSPSDHVSTKQ